MKVFIALCLLAVTTALPKVAFPNADLIRNSESGIQHPNQRLIEMAHFGDSRIVAGANAEIKDHPWQASLRTSSHICGASLISDKWLITAAHCVDPDKPGSYEIGLGQTKRRDHTEEFLYPVKKIIQHPKYGSGSGTFPNDIALIELEGNADLSNSNIGTITMADENNQYENQNCVITGWGRTSGGGSLPDTLQAATMQVLSTGSCRNYWGYSIINSHVCVHKQGPVSACNGDSGGPLVCGSTLVGATSWGRTGCDGDYPSVYTRISAFRDWIRQNSGV